MNTHCTTLNSKIVPESTVFDNRTAAGIIRSTANLIFVAAFAVRVSILNYKAVDDCTVGPCYYVIAVIIIRYNIINIILSDVAA